MWYNTQMGVNSKRKGNTFERTIANLLSERFKDFLGVEQGFMRKPDSGAFFGGKNASRTETHLIEFQTFGDILCPKQFLWAIEAKHYKTPLTLSAILDQKSKQLDDWISQAERDAANAGRQPLLIIKFNNCAPFVLVDVNKVAARGVRGYSGFRFIYKAYGACRLDLFLSGADDTYFEPAAPSAL